VAHDREDNLLADSQLSRVNAIVKRHDLANSSSESLSQVEESVARLDRPCANALAEGVGADRDVDDLTREDKINVFDLRVRGDDSVESNVERLANSPKTIALTDIIGGSDTGHAGLGGFCGWGDAAGLVVGCGAVLWDDEFLARLDEVDVLDVVGCGDVADTGAVELGDGGESVAVSDGVVDGAGRAADISAWSWCQR
jgi:hypothetical protein